MNPRGRLTVTINDLQATAAYRGDYISQALIVYNMEIEMIGINENCISFSLSIGIFTADF